MAAPAIAEAARGHGAQILTSRAVRGVDQHSRSGKPGSSPNGPDRLHPSCWPAAPGPGCSPAMPAWIFRN